jgi:hypothetical protein
LKTEQKQSLEARRSLTGDNQTHRNQIDDAGNINNNNHRPNRRLQDSDSTSTQLLSKQTRFSGSHLRHLRQPLSAPNTTDQAGQTTRQTPKNKLFFFPPEGILIYIKHEQKKTATEIYEGTARVGLAHTGSATTNKRKTQQ